jgi:hypothetical protein
MTGAEAMAAVYWPASVSGTEWPRAGDTWRDHDGADVLRHVAALARYVAAEAAAAERRAGGLADVGRPTAPGVLADMLRSVDDLRRTLRAAEGALAEAERAGQWAERVLRQDYARAVGA